MRSVEFGARRLKAHERSLAGRRLIGVDSRGKALLLHFSGGLSIYTHNQLYGRWRVVAAGDRPASTRSLRLAVDTSVASALLYSASDIEVLDDAGLEAHPFLSRIGPDILDAQLTWNTLAARLAQVRFRGRSLAALYLDQGFLAGTGNYLRSEILHFAGLDPARRPADMSRAERQRLARQTLAVARRSYRTRGITNPPARVRARKAAGDTSRGAHRFAVFARAGKPCDACGATIQRATAGSRRIYFCPDCQA